MRKAVALYCLLILMATGLTGCAGGPATIAGTVTQASDGQTLERATIAVYEMQRAEGATQLDIFAKGILLHKELTAEDGSFSIVVEPGDYLVEVWVEGYTVASRPVKVRAGRVTALDFRVSLPQP
jgi:hypothetical protein